MSTNRYFTFYYISNFVVLLSYPFFRFYLQRYGRLNEEDSFGYTRENGVFCTSLAILWVRWKRSATVDQFLHDIFTIGKISMLLLFVIMDLKYGLYYAFACIFLFLFARQPKYSGPSKMIPISTEDQFQELVLKEVKNTNANKKPVRNSRDGGGFAHANTWVVEFFVDWAETCVYTKPIWSEFSMKYTTPSLKFGEVNLATVPELAKKFNINTSAISRQLPTLILFEDGKELLRFPPVDEDTKRYMKVVKYSKKDIAKYFDLDERFLATRFNNPAPKPTQTENGNK